MLALDFVKAIAIVMVMITHTPMTTALKKTILYPYTILPAVPIFLMCSIYTFSLVEDRKNGDVFSWFSIRTFWKRFNRFLFPFIVALGITIWALFVFRHAKGIAATTLLKMILLGGRGPASYYNVVIFQLLILFPFLRDWFRKSPRATVLGLVLGQLVYETLCRYTWQLDTQLYGLLIFRYLTHLALGFVLYEYRDRLMKTVLPLLSIAIGGIYLVELYYLGYQQVSIYDHASRSMIAVLYSFGLLCCLLRLEDVLRKYQRLFSPVFYIGKASYHIMLAQMVYFYFARMFHVQERFGSIGCIVLVDLIIGISAGCLFYWSDGLARGLYDKLRKKVFV